MRQLLCEISDAVVSYAVLVTTDVSVSAESAEDRLAAELRQAGTTRDKLAQVLLEEVQQDVSNWQLYGAVLTEVNRILDEMDTEHRSQRLLEELDRHTREQREKRPHLTRLADKLGAPVRSHRNRQDPQRRSP